MVTATEGTATLVLLSLMVGLGVGCELLGVPPLESSRRHRDRTEERTQLILPAYQFTCHGVIRSWAACVRPGGHRERYDINFQVWRRQQSDCYTLVGSNVPSEPLAPRDQCVSYRVPHSDQIQVMPGDVVGFYVDRFRVPRDWEDDESDDESEEEELEDVQDGGIRLNDDWSQSVEVLSVPQQAAAGVGSELCASHSGVRLHMLSGAPVITVALDASTSSAALNPFTTTSVSFNSFTTTSVAINSFTTAAVIPTDITTVTTTTKATQETHVPPTDKPVPPSTTIPALSTPHTLTQLPPSPSPTTSLSPQPFIQGDSPFSHIPSVISVTIGSAHHKPPPSSPPPMASDTISKSSHTHFTGTRVQRTITSPIVMMTSSPTLGKAPVEAGEAPVVHPVLVVGLVIAGVLVIAIVVMVILIIVVWVPRPRKKEEGKVGGDSDMEYCDVYIMNRNHSNKGPTLVPNAPMEVRNNAYHKCAMSANGNVPTPDLRNGNGPTPNLRNGNGPTLDMELLPLQPQVVSHDSHMTQPTAGGEEVGGKRHNYVNYNPTRHDYEEVY